MVQTELNLISQQVASAVFGILDGHLSAVEKAFSVHVIGRGDAVTIVGDEKSVQDAEEALLAMRDIVQAGGEVDDQAVSYCINMVQSGEKQALGNLDSGVVLITAKGRPVKAKTVGQRQYIEAIENNYIVFGVGPAGTGKTYLAVVMAINALKKRMVERIILTRPAVEAGEKLGFLPGDLQTKIDPYLRPLYDALFDTLGPETFKKYVERCIIEVAPLAYMRGRTLENSFVILDEAQNTTPEQMKMFLTRLGTGSKMVVNGDITQIDLVDSDRSGLVDAVKVLKNIDGIEQVRFTDKDVVRFRLVADIVKAYDRATQRKASKGGKKYDK